MRLIKSTKRLLGLQIQRTFSTPIYDSLLSTVLLEDEDTEMSPEQQKTNRELECEYHIGNLMKERPMNIIESINSIKDLLGDDDQYGHSETYFVLKSFLESSNTQRNLPRIILEKALTSVVDNLETLYSSDTDPFRHKLYGIIYFGIKIGLIRGGQKESLVNNILNLDFKIKTPTGEKSIYFYSILERDNRLFLYLRNNGFEMDILRPESSYELFNIWRLLCRSEARECDTQKSFLKTLKAHEVLSYEHNNELRKIIALFLNAANTIGFSDLNEVFLAMTEAQRETFQTFFSDFYSSIMSLTSVRRFSFQDLSKMTYLFKLYQGNMGILRGSVLYNEEWVKNLIYKFYYHSIDESTEHQSHQIFLTWVEINYFLSKEGKVFQKDFEFSSLVILTLQRSDRKTNPSFELRPDILSKLINIFYSLYLNELRNDFSLMFNNMDNLSDKKVNPDLDKIIQFFCKDYETSIANIIGRNKLNFPPAFKFFFVLNNIQAKLTERDPCLDAIVGRMQFSFAHHIRYRRVSIADIKRYKLIHKFYKENLKGSRKLKRLIEAAVNREPDSTIKEIFDEFHKVKKAKLRHDKRNPFN